MAANSFLNYYLNHTLVNSFAPDPNSEPAYVFQARANSSHLVVSASNNLIKIYDPNNYAHKGQLEGHSNTIQEITFSNTHPDVLFSCSSDKTARFWDLRAKSAGAVMQEKGEVFTIGVDKGDSMMACGIGNNVRAWDLRTTKAIRSYDSYHSEDVTQVRFHPVHTNTLYSASVDGTICVFDTQITSEDDEMITGMNVEDSINQIGFFGDHYNHLYCLTHTERFSIFNIEGDKVFDFGSVRESLSNEQQLIQYLITCTYDPIQKQLYLIAGDHEGFIGVVQVGDSTLTPVSKLSGGHAATVRSVEWDIPNQRIISGGEDSRVCIWSTVPSTQPTVSDSQLGKVVKTSSSSSTATGAGSQKKKD